MMHGIFDSVYVNCLRLSCDGCGVAGLRDADIVLLVEDGSLSGIVRIVLRYFRISRDHNEFYFDGNHAT
jgi:hypothetical protein